MIIQDVAVLKKIKCKSEKLGIVLYLFLLP